MTSKTHSILIPGVICMIIGFVIFNVLGAAFSLLIGFSMGEQYYRRHELETQVRELQTEDNDEI
ncbi:hypothetical protein [Natrinema versiforme]|uniref:Uncharacterized protein n=1 Tax=Natrinema versiforme JCM 10478 TaxID=1227496 RepID=L9XTS7_9EURY|nr:hypothetical protein [Natrinema versiforme]ELY65209.1 hypothetical protein C489_15552 [Natrinema versiforme JCM 10478]